MFSHRAAAHSRARRVGDFILLLFAFAPAWLLAPLSPLWAQTGRAQPTPLAAAAAIGAVALLLGAFVALLSFVMWRERRATRLQRRKLSAGRET